MEYSLKDFTSDFILKLMERRFLTQNLIGIGSIANSKTQ